MNKIATLLVESSHFQIDRDGYHIVYISGSCMNDGRQNARAGFGVFFGADNPFNRSCSVYGRADINVAEIQAAIAAIRLALSCGILKLCIRTNSDDLLNAVRFWMPDWKQNGWHKADGSLVENRRNFEQLDVTINIFGLPLKWEKVHAYSGDFGKDFADQLAVAGAKMYRTPSHQ